MKIAVFWPNWIGDAVMATPAVRALREHFQGADFIHVLRPYVAGVLEGSPWKDKLIDIDAGSPLALQQEQVDLAILFPNSFRSALIAWLGRCRRRIGYRRNGRAWLLTDALKPILDQRGRRLPSPVLDAYYRLVARVGCTQFSPRMDLYTTDRDEFAADEVWKACDLRSCPEVVCLNPGAAYGSAKYWPTESFSRLAQRLVDARGCGVLVLCGPTERELAQDIVRGAERKAVHSLANHPLSLGLTKGCVRRADLLVTTDSGPRHFAAAFGRPVVTLFGPTHIAWTETYFAKAIHLQKKVDCGPCQLRVCPLDHRCMKLLSSDEVFNAAVRLLDTPVPGQMAG